MRGPLDPALLCASRAPRREPGCSRTAAPPSPMRSERLRLLLLLLVAGCAQAPAERAGVFVLGVDGMDPEILSRMMDEGKMPNFSPLAAEGSFQTLGTSNPPQSPVAWSTFVTGLDPGRPRHLRLRPPRPEDLPAHRLGDARAGRAGLGARALRLLPAARRRDPEEQPRRHRPSGTRCTTAGVNVEVYRMPGNYPPTPSDAKVLSGMGTVDMRGGYGVYTWFTDQPVPGRARPEGRHPARLRAGRRPRRRAGHRARHAQGAAGPLPSAAGEGARATRTT